MYACPTQLWEVFEFDKKKCLKYIWAIVKEKKTPTYCYILNTCFECAHIEIIVIHLKNKENELPGEEFPCFEFVVTKC